MIEKYFIPFVFFLVAAMLITPANAIGAFIPVGDPEIIHTSFVDVVSGEEATLDIVVKNNAEVSASFDILILDPCPCIIGRGYPIRVTIGAGMEETLPFKIRCGTNIDKVGTCQVRIRDVTVSTNEDIGYFNYKVKRAKECEDYGKFFPTGDNCIKKCTSEGYWEIVKCCDDKVVTWKPSDATYGGWVCAKKDGTLPGFESIFVVVGLIIAFVVFKRRRK